MKFENLRLQSIKTVVYYKPDIQSWRATNRRDHIIGINVSGSANHNLGYKHLNLEPNDIYFFNQKDDFDAVTIEAGYCYSIHFTTYEPIETESFCKRVSSTDEIVKMIRRVETAWLQKERGELGAVAEFYRLCDLFFKLYIAPYTQTDQRLLVAKDYIDLHFKESDCLAKAVECTGLSRRRFNDVFKNQFQFPPNRYVITKKIDYAKELLSLRGLSTAEIAELAGFSDVYYFCKMFKQETGLTPGDFKKKRPAE